MKPGELKDLSEEQLAARFESIAMQQDQALLMDEIAKYNRLYDRMEEVETELKGREGDQRRILRPLLTHRNAQVRLKTALALLAPEPDAARATLQAISDAKEFPQAADARGMMRAIDEGSYVPD